MQGASAELCAEGAAALLPTCQALPELVAPASVLACDDGSHAVRLPDNVSAGSTASGQAAQQIPRVVHGNDWSARLDLQPGESAGNDSEQRAACANQQNGAECSAASGLQAVAAGADSRAATEQPASLGVPWQFLSGATNKPLLQTLQWQVVTFLSQQPGASEALLARRMQHALAPQHVRMLLQRMQAKGLLTCVHVPGSLASTGSSTGGLKEACGNASLVHTSAGFVPAMFAQSSRVQPVTTRWFVHAAALCGACLFEAEA